MQLPEQHTPAGQPTAQAQQIINAVEAIYTTPTAYRDTTPLPAVGPTPPVAQPGQQPMSQWAIDASGVLRAVSIASLPVGGALWLVGQIDPLTLALVGGTPVAALLAVSRLVRRAKEVIEAAPGETHNHYNATVYQDTRTVTSHTRGLGRTTNNT
ncbi:hypothetical protein ABZ401_19225 [Streptomyces sp. NPDC005892]|uniref:hypothetical protein n=1 Tax=Streptomyces sp. NPDC005892 TaxID=3155593 RepID=UPI0034090D77